MAAVTELHVKYGMAEVPPASTVDFLVKIRSQAPIKTLGLGDALQTPFHLGLCRRVDL